MSSLPLLATIITLHTLALVSPGPDFLMALKNSLTYSRRTGIYTAIGFALGIAIHIFYCLAGIALIISKSILIFNIIKYLGAAYLIYIGYISLTAKKSHLQLENLAKKEDITPLQAIRSGFLTNVLNPKATLFFLSLFTLVIKPDTSPLVLAVASSVMIINTALWFSLVAIFFTHKRIRNIYERFATPLNRTFGGLLLLLGIKIALTRD